MTDIRITPEMLLDENNVSVRDSFVDRTDIFDKVKALVLLGDTDLATIEMLTNYFEVDGNRTIQKLIDRHRIELEKDGLITLRGNELNIYKLNLMRQGVSLSAKNSLTVIPKRAILRIGMLLTESSIAEAIRTYLLNVHDYSSADTKADAFAEQFKDMPQSKVELVREWLQSLEREEEMKKEIMHLKEQNEILSPLADAYNRYLNTAGLSDMNIVSKLIGGRWGEYRLFKFLRAEGDLYFEKGYNLPHETKANKKYYKVKRRSSNDGKTDFPVTLVTKQGEQHILKLVKKFEYLIGNQEITMHMLSLYEDDKEKFYEDYVSGEKMMELHEQGVTRRF